MLSCGSFIILGSDIEHWLAFALVGQNDLFLICEKASHWEECIKSCIRGYCKSISVQLYELNL